MSVFETLQTLWKTLERYGDKKIISQDAVSLFHYKYENCEYLVRCEYGECISIEVISY